MQQRLLPLPWQYLCIVLRDHGRLGTFEGLCPLLSFLTGFIYFLESDYEDFIYFPLHPAFFYLPLYNYAMARDDGPPGGQETGKPREGCSLVRN